MHSNEHHLRQSQPRVFNYSLDWRFLLPISDAGNIFVLFEDDLDFSQTLEQVDIPVSKQLSFSDIAQIEKKDTTSLVLPFGQPVKWVSGELADQIEFFRSMQKLIGDNGNLLVGFNNSQGYPSKAQTKYHPSTPTRISSQLQKAGFKAVQVFGAFPNLRIPEYIFDLNSQPTYFALQHRFKRKPILINLLQLLSYTIGLTRISNFLPCYYAVAAV